MAFQMCKYSYNSQIEIFMAIRDLELKCGADSLHPSIVHPNYFNLTMIGFLKPPGALQFVEKCVTETVRKDRSPKFAQKMYLNCDTHDADGIELKFQLLEGDYLGPRKTVFMHSFGHVQTTLSNLLAAVSVGLQIPFEVEKQSQGDEILNGKCFLRAEILKPIDDSAIFQFRILRQTPSILGVVSKGGAYYLEIFKINENVDFGLDEPYTLVHRTEPMNRGFTSNCWTPIVLPLARLCNGDWDRVLKLVIHDKDQTVRLANGAKLKGVKIGFVLTTLRKLLDIGENRFDTAGKVLKITKCKDGKESQKTSLMVHQCSIIQMAPFQTYLNNGLAIRRIYAVDFSRSNMNQSRSSEEAIQIVSKIMQPLGSAQSVFYAFGNPKLRPIVETIEERNHRKQLLRVFWETLQEAKQTGFDTDQCFQKLSQHNQQRTTLLSPLLNDLLALICTRNQKSQSEYLAAFIITDGQLADSDLEESMRLVIALANHPISLIFVAIGLGNLEFLLSLQESWIHPTTQTFPKRNIVTVLHFRSLQNWFSAILYGSCFKSDPLVLLQKEILNSVEKQAVQFLRGMSSECRRKAPHWQILPGNVYIGKSCSCSMFT